MQLFSSVLAVAASVFIMVSAEEQQQQHGAKPAPRVSSRSSKVSASSRASRASKPSVIGGDSSVWTPKTHCESSSSSSSSCDQSSSSYVSPCSSSWSSSAAYGCDLPCGIACNPLAPAVTPLSPVTGCDPLYGPGYGAYPAGGCGPCGPYGGYDAAAEDVYGGYGVEYGQVGCGPVGGCAPYPVGNGIGACAPNMGRCVDPCARPCERPCERPCPRPYDRKSRGNRLYAEAAVDQVVPWYVYLTATHTSTYSSTSIFATTTTTEITTVSFRVFTLSYTPSGYPTVEV